MRNSNYVFILIIFLPIILFADGFGECESGDLIFRSGDPYFGHTGIYCDWDESGKPSDWSTQRIVEARGKGNNNRDGGCKFILISGKGKCEKKQNNIKILC